MLPKSGLITTSAVGPDMKRRTRNLLTTLIVLTITAIFIVGFVLAWDIFDFKGKLDELVNTDFYASAAPLYRSSVTINLTSSGASALPAEERELIENYFKCFYASLGGFYHEDMSRFYGFECVDEFLDDLALDFEIAAAKNASADYSFDSCDLYLYIISRRTTKEDTVEITLRSSAKLRYDFCPIDTSVSDENHTFVISLDDERLITAHSTDRISRKYADMVMSEAAASDGYVLSDLSYTYFYPYASAALDMVDEKHSDFTAYLSEMLNSEKPPSFSAEYPYDSSAACSYARESEGHSGKFGSYDDNDVNFCSQCLYAGGIPMDAQGDKLTQWKWYDYEENNAREHEGCTVSWYDRKRFWTYATENTGFGLVAETTSRARAGDIIQLMNGDEPVLQCIISGTVLDKNNLPVDYLICTDKIKNKPLSLLWNGDIRVISVLGYNTANM